jgi:hypothetical protein
MAANLFQPPGRTCTQATGWHPLADADLGLEWIIGFVGNAKSRVESAILIPVRVAKACLTLECVSKQDCWSTSLWCSMEPRIQILVPKLGCWVDSAQIRSSLLGSSDSPSHLWLPFDQESSQPTL